MQSYSACLHRTIGDLHGDSIGFGLLAYKSWYNAKYGEISCHDYAKLHVIAAAAGKIVAFEVTSGTTADSPQFKRIPLDHTLPHGMPCLAYLLC